MNPQSTKSVVCMVLTIALIGWCLWNSVPRLTRDYLHAGDYVPAQSRTVTRYECTNWNGGIVSECTITFAPRQGGAAETFTDWRFGPAPRDAIHLMERRTDAAAVTTDVSLRTVKNRLMLTLTFVAFGLLIVFALVKAGAAKVASPAR